MSTHRFTIEVQCDGSADYERVLDTFMQIGAEVIDEESDFND